MTRLFLGLVVVLLALVGVAAAKDSHDRQYLSIQDQYRKDYGGSFDAQAQQLFPVFAAAKQGDTFRVERCISCHVPDIGQIGPEKAAQRLSQDFFRYAPDAQKIKDANHLTGTHPAFITQELYDKYGEAAFATPDGFRPYTVKNGTNTVEVKLPGFIPQFLSPKANGGRPLGLDQVGCISCHNGGRLSLEDTAAHQNLIINPEYSWTEGARLYYQSCAQCHGNLGEGLNGPPLNNQDRLGYFNEDYYYRCIEWGRTDYEHLGSVMPNWGSVAPDFTYDRARDGAAAPSRTRVLSEDQINTLVQFIRHWENYQTLP